MRCRTDAVQSIVLLLTLSVHLPVCNVTLRDCGHIYGVTSKIITWVISLESSLCRTLNQISRPEGTSTAFMVRVVAFSRKPAISIIVQVSTEVAIDR